MCCGVPRTGVGNQRAVSERQQTQVQAPGSWPRPIIFRSPKKRYKEVSPKRGSSLIVREERAEQGQPGQAAGSSASAEAPLLAFCGAPARPPASQVGNVAEGICQTFRILLQAVEKQSSGVGGEFFSQLRGPGALGAGDEAAAQCAERLKPWRPPFAARANARVAVCSH